MLSSRIAPTLVIYAQMRYASYQPLLAQSITTVRSSTCTPGAEPNRFPASNVEHGLWPARTSHFTITRSFSEKKMPKMPKLPKLPEMPKIPNIPNMPSKNEVEKTFFKVTVIVWDLVWLVTMWTWAMFRAHVINNPKVQEFWKMFSSKLDKAREANKQPSAASSKK